MAFCYLHRSPWLDDLFLWKKQGSRLGRIIVCTGLDWTGEGEICRGK